MVGGRGAGRRSIQNVEDPEVLGGSQVWGLAPIPQGSGDSPFPGRGLCWSSPRRPAPGSQWLPTPTREHSHPLPSPRDGRIRAHSVYYCSLSAPPAPRLGRACRLAAWQEPAVSLWVPASPGLVSAWTPLPGSGHSGTWYPPRLPSPGIPPPLAYHPCPPGTAPQQGGGQSPHW